MTVVIVMVIPKKMSKSILKPNNWKEQEYNPFNESICLIYNHLLTIEELQENTFKKSQFNS